MFKAGEPVSLLSGDWEDLMKGARQDVTILRVNKVRDSAYTVRRIAVAISRAVNP